MFPLLRSNLLGQLDLLSLSDLSDPLLQFLLLNPLGRMGLSAL